jgi:hypothetical protein
MCDQRPERESMSIEEATVSNKWEIAAIVEVLEQKGLCTHAVRPLPASWTPGTLVSDRSLPKPTVSLIRHIKPVPINMMGQ